MTRAEFAEIAEYGSVFDALYELENECDEITCEEILKEFIAEHVMTEDYALAEHLCSALNETYSSTGLWRYDYCMGLLDTPTPVENIDDVEDLFND